MIIASMAVSCAAVGLSGYQLYWLRRLRAATRELRRLAELRARRTP